MRKKFLLTMFSLVLFAFCGTSLNAQVARVNGTEYETLTAAFAAVTNDNQDVVVLKDVTEDLVGAYLRGNITTENGAKVTITLTNSGENYYIYCPYTFILGENVTLKVPSGCLFYYAGGTQINGALVTNGYYQRYAGTKLTINEPGSMTVTSETCIIRYMDGDANAGIYVNGDNDDSTIGLNLIAAYFYQGVISAKNANIKTAVYWQTNETDGQGSANLVLDNSTLTVYGGELNTIVSGNSTVTLKNESSLTTNSEFQYGNDTQFVVDATSSIKVKDDTYDADDFAKVLEGEGTEEKPFLIKNLDDLVLFRNSVNAGETKYNAPGVYVALAADIDMEGIDWSVNIGDDCNATFDGIFDGKNHKISNLTSTETAKKADGYICTGLFGAIYGDAVVKNFTIEDVTINTGDFTGNNVSAVVGFAYNAKGSVENVTVKGDIKINAPKTTAVGAIVGYAYGSSMTVKDCKVIGNDNSVITGAAYVGGIIGYSTKDALNANTVNNVDINATSCAAGGVAGIMLAGGSAKDNTIENVNLESEHANWKNAAGIVVGSITGTVTISGTTYSDVNTDRIVGSAHADKPTTPVAKVEARIGDVYYTTYAKAYEAATAGQTIELLADVELASKLTINKSITINGNGHNIKYTSTEYDHMINISGTSDVTLENLTIDCNKQGKSVNVIKSQKIIFDNVSIINAARALATLTVNGSTVTTKTAFSALGCSIAIDLSKGSGITVEEGTVFNLDNKTVKFASDANVETLTNAVNAEGEPYFAAKDNAYYYTIAQMESRATAYSNGLTILADVELEKAVLNVKSFLNLNGHSVIAANAPKTLPAGYSSLVNLDGKYVIGATPTATVENLGSMVVEAGEYFVKNLQGSGDNTKDMPLQFVMQYTADQNAEQVAVSPYKEWYADFVLSFSGLANGSFVADENTYLAGFYGETEKWEGIWAKVGITGMEITEGTRYPVMLGVGMPQNYEYICAGVEEFLCAMNISSEILNANPNLKVTLELCLVDNSNDDAALNALQTGEKCNVAAKKEFTADDFAKVLEGEGTEEKPFLIKNLDDLVLFRNSVNAGETKYNAPGVYVALAADINMEGIDWSVNIGDDCNATFDGIFDGKDHTISNLTSTETAKKADGYICTGLFGAIYGDAVVKNFTIEDVTINTGDFTGNNVSAVVGFAYNAKGSVENVTVTGDIKINAPKTTAVGAIVGYAYGSSMTVKDCEVIGNDNSVITGAAYVGGIIGYSTKDALNANTVNNVDINATSCAAGGVAGIMLAGGSAKDNTIENVNLESEHANWKNAAGIVVGSITGTVTISGTTYSDVNTDRIVGSAHADKPTTPVAKVEARIGDVYYTTYAKAYAAANAGETITLLCDAQGAGIVIDKNVTIDFNGYTYTFSELGVGSGTLTSNGFQILNGNDVTLKNGTLNVAEAMKDKYYILIQNYANLNVEKMTLDGTNLDKWSLTDGDSYVLSNNSGEVNIINSKIIANNDGTLAYAFDVCKKASYEAPVVTLDDKSTIDGKVELSGGQFYPAKAVTVSMTKAVESYQVADNNEELKSGWYTISAPFAVKPTLTEGYELFRYNEATAMWENHKNSEHNSFGLEVGRGYLYAHANGADLNLEGVANIADYKTTLSYTTDATHELKGFHLVGNPYTFSISGEHFSGNVADGFYTLANSGAWVVKQTADEIAVGEGFLVQAKSTTNFAINKTATATRSADNGSLQINVANAKYSDVAYVSFNEGVGLSKISHQNTNIPMVYVPVGGENYSIAYMNANVEEIPFAFEAKTMGSYTISVEAQNCEFETMTLVDRFTGIETNLLLEDYSFIAKSGDNSDRFIIRLSNETLNLGDENFVYINNNGLIIDNASSNATLQIFDVMGRPVASYNLSGSANISMESLTNGVYILRLMDENNVRVQKVVID